MARTQITITAADADFHERRRARIIRRAERRERERRIQSVLDAMLLAAPILAAVGACQLYSLWALGMLG